MFFAGGMRPSRSSAPLSDREKTLWWKGPSPPLMTRTFSRWYEAKCPPRAATKRPKNLWWRGASPLAKSRNADDPVASPARGTTPKRPRPPRRRIVRALPVHTSGALAWVFSIERPRRTVALVLFVATLLLDLSLIETRLPLKSFPCHQAHPKLFSMAREEARRIATAAGTESHNPRTQSLMQPKRERCTHAQSRKTLSC
jgi:hypothetical protein